MNLNELIERLEAENLNRSDTLLTEAIEALRPVDELQSQLAATKQTNEVFETSLRKQRTVLEEKLAEANSKIYKLEYMDEIGKAAAMFDDSDALQKELAEAKERVGELKTDLSLRVAAYKDLAECHKDRCDQVEFLKAQIAEYDKLAEKYADSYPDFSIRDSLTRIRQMGEGG